MLLAALCLPVALARPQWGRTESVAYESSREVLLALDLSRSMLVSDIPPSRLARARLLMENLLDHLRGERIGLLLFAGTSFLQCPLSSDYEILREFLPELNPDYLPQGGTQFRAMLETASNAFSKESGSDRFLIILSDGEDLGGDWKEALPILRQQRIRVIALGIGTTEGGIVPGRSGGVVKDERGAAVLSRMNPEVLEELATSTEGVYGDGSVWVDLAGLIHSTVAQGHSVEFQKQEWTEQTERFQWPLFASCCLAGLSLLLEFPGHPRRRLRQKQRATSPSTAAGASLLCLWVGTLSGWGQGTPTAPPPDPLKEIATTVKVLADAPARPPEGYAQLAQATITYGQSPEHGQDTQRKALIEDALEAVAEGRRLDPKAAPWDQLEQQLKQLLTPPQPPPSEKSSKNNQQRPQSSDKQPSSDNPKSEESENQKKDASEEKQDAKKGNEPSPKSSADNSENSSDKKSDPQKEAQDHEQKTPAQPPSQEGETKEQGNSDKKKDPLAALENDDAPQTDKIQSALRRDSPGRLFLKLDSKQQKSQHPETKKDW
jgi:Ca-activated chloride channel family protein